jgi:hypothetical protein
MRPAPKWAISRMLKRHPASFSAFRTPQRTHLYVSASQLLAASLAAFLSSLLTSLRPCFLRPRSGRSARLGALEVSGCN